MKEEKAEFAHQITPLPSARILFLLKRDKISFLVVREKVLNRIKNYSTKGKRGK